MITSLNIRNFVIVEHLELELPMGFTALTGQTGAGKSILIDALQLLFGARSDTEFIRQGCDKSDLSASFSVSPEIKEWLDDRELDNGEEELIIRRTLDISGKSRAWINGYPSTLAQLKDLSSLLVLIHGQHAHQSLLRRGAQLQMLDGYCKLGPKLFEIGHAWDALSTVQAKLRKAKEEASLNAERLERIRWFLEDMKDLGPSKNEWASINEEHTRLSRATDILEACQSSRGLLTEEDSSVLSMIDTALDRLGDVIDTDQKLEKIYNALTDAREIVDSASDDIEHYLSRTDFDESRFAELDTRLSDYNRMASKYHLEPEQLYNEYLTAKKKAHEFEELGDLTALEQKVKEAKEVYDALAAELSRCRKKGAQSMERQITKAMQTLAMEGGKFEISVQNTEHPGPSGTDSVEFLVAGHAGVAPRPLIKVASGGELARISLAIAVTDSSMATVDTLIFDEVDTGIGGAVAETVGRLLKSLGANQQVLCVTHLSQVAGCAENHFRIEKVQSDKDKAPTSRITLLTPEERVEEISRMMGGLKITEVTREHAKEMLHQG